MKYTTVARESSAKFTDRKSSFTAYVFPFFSEETLKERLLEIKKKHKDAAHIPFAFRVNNVEEKTIQERYSDDGEPSKTAGFPVLRLLQQKNLVNVLIIVARIYGGVKLGPAGLMKAFSTAAQQALNENELVEREQTTQHILQTDIYHFAQLETFLKQHQLEYTTDFNASSVKVTLQLPDSLRSLEAELERLSASKK